MKKTLATILAIIYLSTSMGATIHLHYCMGKLVAWGLMDTDNKDCISCGMPKQPAGEGCMVAMKGCCHDEHKQIKNDKDQKPGQGSPELIKLLPAAVTPSYSLWQAPFVNSLIVGQPAINGPPLTNEVPVFLRNCNFRI
ncbi:MAG TPA: hypothetical protein VHD83_25625 [Puia sp.]|nr:hypothetical protein [Puia sp.]